MQALSTNVKVGLLVIAGLISFFALYSFLRTGQPRGPSNEYWAVFADASGLALKSEVRVAGVAVGEVVRIELVEGKARVYLTVQERVEVYPNAVVAKRSSSILGDFLLDLDPGFSAPLPPGAQPQGPGTARTQPLPDGSRIPNVKDAASMERLFESLAEITNDVQRVTSGLDELITSERGSIHQIIQNVERITERVDGLVARSSDEVEIVLRNAEVISENLRRITSGKDEDIDAIVSNLRELTEEAKRALQSFQGVMGEDGEVGVTGTLANLDRSLSNLESITGRIDRGEGTLGRLISDERLGERVSLAVEGAADYVTRLTALRAEIALRTDYLFRAESAKNYVSLRLIPAPDKYFLVEVVDDPLGFTYTETIIRSPPGETEAAHQQIRKTTDALKFSAQIAKRYSFFAIRFGLIESSGGLGLDLRLLRDRLEVQTDLFEFARPEAALPRLRAYANLYVIPHLYVSGGIDDALNTAQFDPLTGAFQLGRDYFVGGGIYFTDEDLKVIFGTISGGLP